MRGHAPGEELDYVLVRIKGTARSVLNVVR